MKQCNLNAEQREWLADYLLGGLPAHATRKLERHLATCCPRCENELAELREMITMLAYSAPSATPSESVRGRLFARLEQEPRASSNPPLRLITAAHSWYKSPLDWLVRIAASLVVLMLLAQTVYVFNIKQRASQQAVQIAQLKEQISKKQDLISTIGTSRRLIILEGQLIKASGRAFWDTDHNNWLFYIEKLPPAPNGKTYQLWFITKQRPISGGSFQTDANGRAELHLSAPISGLPIMATAVSLEPEGGSTQPKGVIYLLGQV
ncbi:MAG: anti-sigma factor [Acidobacteriota bacterium]